MAVTFFTGFESAAAGLDGIGLAGAVPAAYSTAQARTGTRSIRCNPTAGNTSHITIPATAGWLHFGLYIATMPTTDRLLVNSSPAGVMYLSSTGRLQVDSTAGLTVLTTGQWYWIGLRRITGTFDGVWATLNGVAEVSRSCNPTTITTTLGFSQSFGSVADIYIDDIIIDNAGFLAPSKVTDLLPIADNVTGTGWTLGSGGTSNLHDAVNNQPPAAVADAGTTNQIRNAASSANSIYTVNMQSYTTGGVGSGDTVLAVQNVIATAAPVTTSAKQGTVGNFGNPAITNIALGAGGTAGAFWSGVAGGTYPTGWKVSTGTLTTSPSVALGTFPRMSVTQVTASTRIAMVAYMALRVAWTPAAAPSNVTVTPTTAALVITRNVPTVTTSNHQTVTPTTKALTSARFAPTVRTPITATPAAVSLTATKYAPTVTATAHQRVTPTTATLTATKYAPTVRTPQTVTPTTKALTLTKYAPTVTAFQGQTVTPTTRALGLSPNAPLVTTSNNQRVIPTTKALSLAAFAPAVSSSNHQRVTPTTTTLTATRYAPTVTASAHQRVTPTTRALTITRYAPSVGQPAQVQPTTKALVLATFAPTVTSGTSVTVRPTTAALTLTELPPTAVTTAHQLLIVQFASLAVAGFAPSVETHSGTALPDPIYGWGSVIGGGMALPEVDGGPGALVGSAQGGATVAASEGGSTAVSTSGPSARVTIR